MAAVLLVAYNTAQPGLELMRGMDAKKLGFEIPQAPTTNANGAIITGATAMLTSTQKAEQDRIEGIRRERYGPSLEWLDRLTMAGKFNNKYRVSLDFRVLSSMMIAGLASGFRSQVANLLWMKSDEYWHEGLMNRQIPIMEAVVTLDPQFIDAWSTAGWHWAYNIYAEEPNKPELKNNPKALRAKQQSDIETGLDYLDRGEEMNPETYRLWFENAWTRANKAGIFDERTVNLLREARTKSDARTIELSTKAGPKKEEGLDLVGRTIGHIYEQVPDIDKALAQYRDLMRPDKGTGPLPSDAEMKLLRKAGEAWGRFGSNYAEIIGFYNSSDATIKAQIKRLVPDIEEISAGQKMRDKMGARESQATGAYVSIVARYLPAWNLMKAGKLQQAQQTIIGVMNAEPQYHLQGLNTYARVLEMRGDAPAAVETALKNARSIEKDATQNIGLNLLAVIYEKEGDWKNAYRTWYRGRERNTLDFFARRNAQLIEDKYNFTPPEDIIKEVKASRKAGDPNAAPPPNVSQYQSEGAHAHTQGDGHDHDIATP